MASDIGPDDSSSRFHPFILSDAYGERGKVRWMAAVRIICWILVTVLPLPLVVRWMDVGRIICWILVTVFPLRLGVCAIIPLFYYLVCKVCTLFQAPNEQENYANLRGWRRTVIVNLGKFLSRIFLFLLGFYWIEVIDLPPDSTANSSVANEGNELGEDHGRPGAIISNRVSYIDILYHMSSSFPSFVAQKSVAKLPIVGHISKCLGCIYVKKESELFENKKPNAGQKRKDKPKVGQKKKDKLKDAQKKEDEPMDISAVLEERIRAARQDEDAPQLVLFPEGTTTNGDFLLPFSPGAFSSKAPVLPVILRYPYKRFNVAWVSMPWVIRMPVFYPSQEEKDDSERYAGSLRQLMAAKSSGSTPSPKKSGNIQETPDKFWKTKKLEQLKPSKSGLREKKEYLKLTSGSHKSD